MRTNVTFRHPAEFIPVADEDMILSVTGVAWFIELLHRIDGLTLKSELCQEDWGVVVFAERAEKRFWIGLSPWPMTENGWLAHFNHNSSSWIQRWSATGKQELNRLARDFHTVLTNDQKIDSIAWYRKGDMQKPDAPSAATPTVK